MFPRAPKISIVLPTHNGAEYIRRSIDSCLNQTYENLELIIVDDASTDETPEIIKSYNDSRIVHLTSRKNLHLPKALNLGFSYATGNYLTWTSDDNEYLPEAMEIMKSYLEENRRIDLVYSDYWAHYQDTGKTELKELKDELNLKEGNTLGGCFLYSRRIFEIIGNYNPKYELVEDYDYWIRISKQFKTMRCGKPLYIYMYHENSLTTKKEETVMLLSCILRFQNGFMGKKEFVDNMKWNISRAIGNRNKIEELIVSNIINVKKISSISVGIALTYLLNLVAVVLSKGGRFVKKKMGSILSSRDFPGWN